MDQFRWQRSFVLLAIFSMTCMGAAPDLRKDAAESDGNARFLPAKVRYDEPVSQSNIDFLYDQPILSVRVNGAGPFSMLLDTTTRTVVFDDRIVRDAGLTTLGKLDDTALLPSGAESADVVHVNFFSIDAVRFSHFDAIAVDLDALTEGPRMYDGTFPLSFFSTELLTIDYVEGQVILQREELPEPNGDTVFGCDIHDGTPIVKVTLAGMSLNAAIHTANQMACTFPPEKKEAIVAAYGQAPTDHKLGRQVLPDVRGAGRLRIGKHEVSYPPFEIKPGRPTIGGLILRNFAITFDQKNARVRFSRDESRPIEFSFLPKYGVEFERNNRKLFVFAVFPDSPVDKSFLKVGHEIVRIESRPVFQYSDMSLRALMDRSDIIMFDLLLSGVRAKMNVRAVPR